MPALGVAFLTGALAIIRAVMAPGFPSDLDHLWYAAQALRAGENPYEVVGPGKEYAWAWPVFYPLPAILLVLPFSFVPLNLARTLFSVGAGGILGFAMGPRWKVMWPLLLSEAYFIAISRNQWAPFLLAAIWLPAFGFFAAAKPNIGMVALAGQKRDSIVRVICLAGASLAVAFIVRPTWLGDWLTLVQSAPNKEVALLQPGGFLLLGALALWRSAEGRILLAMVVIPQTPSVYDLLLLFALCRTMRQALLLALLTYVLQWSVLALGPYPDFDASYHALARLAVWLTLIPVMLLALANHGVLFRQTAQADVPERNRPVGRLASLDTLLLFVLMFAFSLQLWVLDSV